MVLKYYDVMVMDVLFVFDDLFLVSTFRDGIVAMWNIF